LTRKKSITSVISGSRWPDEAASGIFVQWCIHLGTTELGLSQWSGPTKPGGAFTISNPAENRSFTVTPDASLSWKAADIVGIDPGDVRSVMTLAAEKTRATDSGPDLVYQVTMESASPSLDGDGILNFFRILGDQIPITGARRLSDVVLLNFTQEPPQVEQPLFVPDTKISATLFLPGPVQGPLAQNVARATFETVAAICALALGRPVDLPGMIFFPVSADLADSQNRRRYDTGIQGLARNHVSLDIFGDLAILGGPDAMIRARNAFITIHEAQRQSNADIATMLYVCAIEALITPGRQCKWRKEQVTKRFRTSVLSLCGPTIDELLSHQNLEEGLGFRKRGNIERQRRDLADHMYDLRSLPTHTGIGPRGTSLMMLADERSMKLGFLSDLARAALLAYIQAPRSSLTGHPGFQD
jgi:hypothetical protein